MKKVYIAGKITGDPSYRSKFRAAQRKFEREGYKAMNPAALPRDFPYECYFPICRAMIDSCEYFCLLCDWTESQGAKRELIYAIKHHKRIMSSG